MKNICLLGGTGSIGKQVLEVMETMPEEYTLTTMAFGENTEAAEKIISKFKPSFVSAKLAEDAHKLQSKYPDIEFGYGSAGLIKAATYDVMNPVVINSLVGSVGLVPTVKAIECGRNILLANKETLVMAGEIITTLARKHQVDIIPIDSEHSAIFQLLMGNGNNKKDVRRLILTASGGPFLKMSRQELQNVTRSEALNHPNWKMGAKISIDSATMMNKGFELIEAKYLFDCAIEKIDVLIHPESIIHSLVEFNDHSQLAQLAVSDMRIPIQYALTYPHHLNYQLSEPLDLAKVGQLTFYPLDEDRFPAINLAKEALTKGGLYPAALNASNEASVMLFLDGKISFTMIEDIIIEAMSKVPDLKKPSLDDILALDQRVKEKINRKYNR